jgi:hypothetical protein
MVPIPRSKQRKGERLSQTTWPSQFHGSLPFGPTEKRQILVLCHGPAPPRPDTYNANLYLYEAISRALYSLYKQCVYDCFASNTLLTAEKWQPLGLVFNGHSAPVTDRRGSSRRPQGR